METITTDIWGAIFQAVDFVYIIMCNVITYVMISIIESYQEISTGRKRIISAIIACVLGCVMIAVFKHDREAIFYGFFLQFFVYDYIWKWIIKKLTHNIEKIGSDD